MTDKYMIRTNSNLSYFGKLEGVNNNCILLNISQYNDIFVEIPRDELKVCFINDKQIRTNIFSYSQNRYKKNLFNVDTFSIINKRQITIIGKVIGIAEVGQSKCVIIAPSSKTNINYFIPFNEIATTLQINNTILNENEFLSFIIKTREEIKL